MKKSTKSLWLYAAILCIIAIALISTATLLQARLISADGGIEVLGTFTKNAKQNIENLTNENIELTNKLHALTNDYNALKTDFDNIFNENAKESRHKEIMRQMYDAYKNGDDSKLEEIFKMIEEQKLITKEEADQFIPSLYNRAKTVIESNGVE